MSGWTIGGMPRHTTSLAGTAKPQARISSTVGRLQRQPPAKRRHGWSRLSWQAARNRELARTVFDEQQLPIRAEHACDLTERKFGVVDGAKDERRDDGVHGRIGQW